MRWSQIVRRHANSPIVDWPSTIRWPPFLMPRWPWHYAARPAPLSRKWDVWPRNAPNNTLANEIYLPEVKAATALLQHHPEQVAGLVSPAAPYLLVSKVPHLLGRASLEMKNAQQAMTDFEPGIRYRALSLGEGATGAAQVPDYALCLLGTARAQSTDRSRRIRANLRATAPALEECRRRFHPRAGSPARADRPGCSKELRKTGRRRSW